VLRDLGPAASLAAVARVVRSLALALVAAYLAAATTPCPPAARANAEAASLAGAAVHGSRDHVLVAPDDAAPAGHPASAHRAALHASGEAHWTARCLCGCGERPSVGMTPIGVGWAMVSRAPLPLPLPSGDALVVAASITPEAPARGVDHVPLPA